MTLKSLQIPTILELNKSVIRVAHPDISGYPRTEVVSPFTAEGTTLTVADNDTFEDNDFFLLGEPGDAKTEEDDVDGAVTRGTSMTITNTTKFSHEIHTPVTKIYERKIKIYGAATDGGAGTVIASVGASGVDIQWNKPYTEITFVTTDTAYAYYYATFYDGTTESAASDYVLAAGLDQKSGYEMVKSALREVNAEVDGDLITWDWLLDCVNDWQDEVTNYITRDGVSKDWSWEMDEDTTGIQVTQNEYSYALSGITDTLKYPLTPQGIFEVRLGSKILELIDIDELEECYDGKVRGALTVAAAAADTSITLGSSYEFSEAGTVYVGPDTATYTANAESTGVLSGIGTSDITDTRAIGTIVWQGVSPGVPDKYAIYNGNILLNRPVDSTIALQYLKFKFLKSIDRLTSLSESTSVAPVHLAKYYIANRILERKGDEARADRYLNLFMMKLEELAKKDRLPLTEEFEYYNFSV